MRHGAAVEAEVGEVANATARVRVTLYNIAGDASELWVPQDCTVGDFKQQVACLWQVPPALQQIMAGGARLEDDGASVLAAAATTDAFEGGCVGGVNGGGVGGCRGFVVTVVVAAGSLCEDLASADARVRLDALSELGDLAVKAGGRSAVLRIAADLVEEGDAAMADQAARIFARLAEPRDQVAIDLVGARLLHPCPRVRATAVSLLVEIAERGDMRAIAAAAAGLTHPDPGVRQAGADAVTQVAERGEDYAVESMLELLDHDDLEVQLDVLQVYARIAHEDDLQAMQVLSRFAAHPEARARAAAMQALASLSTSGAAPAIELAVGRLSDVNGLVRREAISALLHVGHGDALALAKVKACFGDEGGAAGNVRRIAALQALMELSRPGDEAAVQEAMHLLGHADVCVRQAAMQSLAWVAQRWGHAGALAAIAERASGVEPHARAEAVRLLASLAGEGDARAAEIASGLLEHPNATVRHAGLQVLLEAAGTAWVSSVSRSLEHSDPQVRQAAMRALAHVPDEGGALDPVRARLQHPLPYVREAAASVLKSLSAGGTGMCWL